jgi:integrase
MAISRRGSSFQCSITHAGKRVRRSFPTHAEALRWEANARERLTAGLPTEEVHESPSATMTLRALVDTVTLKYWRGTANEDNATRNAEACLKFLGEHRDPSSVTTSDIDALTAHLTELGNSPGTVNRKLAALSKCLRFAASRGIITRPPTIERKREPVGRLRWYSVEEEDKILEAAREIDPMFHDLLIILFDTGCRLSEALGLQWGDLDGTFARFMRTKNGSARAVPLVSRLKEMLEARRSGGSDPQEAILKFGDRFACHRLWKQVTDRAGIVGENAVIHTIRHTCASRLVQAGTPIQVVQQWLGHKSLTMTLRYAHLAPHNIVAAAAALERQRN